MTIRINNKTIANVAIKILNLNLLQLAYAGFDGRYFGLGRGKHEDPRLKFVTFKIFASIEVLNFDKKRTLAITLF